MPLPSGWCWTDLRTIAELKGGATKGQQRKAGTAVRLVPYLRVVNVQRGYLDLSEIKTIDATEAEIADLLLLPGDILFNEGGDRDKLGRGWVWSGQVPDCIHQNHVFRARLHSPDIDPRFVSWYGNSAGQSYFLEHGKQTTNLASINLTLLGSLPIPLPPAEEQRRIVLRIDELLTRLDAGVAGLKQVQAKLKRYRAAVLKAAVEGTLTADWRAQHPDVEPAAVLFERILQERRGTWEQAERAKYVKAGKTPPEGWLDRYQTSPVGVTEHPYAVPSGWRWTALAAIAELKGGIAKSQHRRPDAPVRPVAYLRVANVQRGYLDLTEIKYINATDSDIRDMLLQPGDVLFNEGGDRDKLGRGWVWGGEIDSCIHQNHVFRARLCLSGIQPKFISWLGNSYGQRYFLDQGKQTTNLASINLATLSQLPVPLPPLAEQEQIVSEVERRLSVVAAAEAQIEAALKRAERLRQSILQQAFAGRLVPQDPGDEPAAVLLERIRAGRNGHTPRRAVGKPVQLPLG